MHRLQGSPSCFDLLYGISPCYIHDIITKYRLARSLRSALSQLTLPRTHHSSDHRSFSNAAPELWNNLPFQLRQQRSLSSFKSSLKTHTCCCLYSVRCSQFVLGTAVVLRATLGRLINPINFKLGTFINYHLKMCSGIFRHDDVISSYVTFL